MVRGVGNVVGLALVRAFGSPEAVFRASRRDLEAAGVRPPLADAVARFDGWGEVDRQLRRLAGAGGRLVTWADADYPEALRQIHDPPMFLFTKGEFEPRDRLAVAVVGSRAAGSYGRQMARKIAKGLTQYGVTVVSGLARGIDGEAHRTALAEGGRTIAVLGCGIDVVYPCEHKRLQAEIARNGVVVSEFSMGDGPEAEHFPRRNRIISGLSLAAVVVEASRRSGSLIPARCALEQGREVFAVPGPVGEATRGAHWLLRQGASLAEDARDVLAEVAPQIVPPDGAVGRDGGGSLPAPGRRRDPRQTALPAEARCPVPRLDEAAGTVLACLEQGTKHVDEIAAETGRPVVAVLQALLQLELSGLVRQEPGKYFSRTGGGTAARPLGA